MPCDSEPFTPFVCNRLTGEDARPELKENDSDRAAPPGPGPTASHGLTVLPTPGPPIQLFISYLDYLGQSILPHRPCDFGAVALKAVLTCAGVPSGRREKTAPVTYNIYTLLSSFLEFLLYSLQGFSVGLLSLDNKDWKTQNQPG